jgi:hypothetical protein
VEKARRIKVWALKIDESYLWSIIYCPRYMNYQAPDATMSPMAGTATWMLNKAHDNGGYR